MDVKTDPERLREQFRGANPFPHLVLDGLFTEDSLQPVLDAFPGPEAAVWRRFDNERELGIREGLGWEDERIASFLLAASAPPMLEFLERLSGIEGLVPDPYFAGGGLHQTVRGGFLKVHADFNWHPKLRLDRRLNTLIYLNGGWRVDQHLRLVADIAGEGHADLIGFGNDAVWFYPEPKPDTIPFYQFIDPRNGLHFYTTHKYAEFAK